MSSLLRDALDFAFIGESKQSRRLSQKSSGSSRRSESFFSCAAESDATSFKSCHSALEDDETFHNAQNDIHEVFPESNTQIPMGDPVDGGTTTMGNKKNSITIISLANKKDKSNQPKPKCFSNSSRTMELLAIFLLTFAGIAAAVRMGMGSNNSEAEEKLQTNDDNLSRTLNNTNESDVNDVYQVYNVTMFPSAAPTNVTEASSELNPCEDDDDEKFRYHRKDHDCKWLQRNVRRHPDRYMKLCFPDGPAYEICQKTCNSCWL
jgi:hypothetical protein